MNNSKIDYVLYSDRSEYLFKAVRPRFHKQHSIGAFDLFSIIAWKANRAKSRVARKLLEREGDLERAARKLSRRLWRARSQKERLLVLVRKWDIRLPMASAILTVLWPGQFTVYDQRVCEQLKKLRREDYSPLKNRRAERVWDDYCDYRDAVRRATPRQRTLRKKDRYLWGRSAAEQLKQDIRSNFRPRRGREG